MSLHEGIDVSRIDLAAAHRLACERGMAERARILRAMAAAAVAAVRSLFTAPAAAEKRCDAC